MTGRPVQSRVQNVMIIKNRHESCFSPDEEDRS